MTPDTLEQSPVATKQCTSKQVMSQPLHKLTCNSLSPGRTQLSIPHG